MNENTPPSSYKHLTDIQIEQCLTLEYAEWSQQTITREVGCSKSTVGRDLRDYNYETFVRRKKYLKPMSGFDDWLLIRTARKHYNLPFHNISNISNLSQDNIALMQRSSPN